MSTTHHVHPIDPGRVAHARSRLPSADDAARLSSLLSLMADPVRLRLIYALDVAEELCVGDLALALEVSEDSVSYALRLLRAAGLLIIRRQGRVVYNRLAEDFPAPLRDHCLRQLIALTHTTDGTDGDEDTDGPTATSRKDR
jgi:DNA-binding transcriptional ArsR family regulator